MGWIRRLLTRDREYNPEECARIHCEKCHGSGHFWQERGADGKPGPILRGNCPDCRGKGWLMVRRESD